jgi:hypothetical protein
MAEPLAKLAVRWPHVAGYSTALSGGVGGRLRAARLVDRAHDVAIDTRALELVDVVQGLRFADRAPAPANRHMLRAARAEARGDRPPRGSHDDRTRPQREARPLLSRVPEAVRAGMDIVVLSRRRVLPRVGLCHGSFGCHPPRRRLRPRRSRSNPKRVDPIQTIGQPLVRPVRCAVVFPVSSGIRWARLDSNQGPTNYEFAALTN